jgi:hypothetical protein
MSIIEKSDVERHRRDINLCRPVIQPDATGFSGVEPDEIKPNSAEFPKTCNQTIRSSGLAQGNAPGILKTFFR